MCGVVGVFAVGNFEEKSHNKIRNEIMLLSSIYLLNQTQVRGPNATGVSVMFDSGDYYVTKMGIKSSDFLTRFDIEDENSFTNFLTRVRKNSSNIRNIIGHCRKNSVGDVINNDNNHPIIVNDIVGVHNGTLKNHDKIFYN